jgi:hypothetical protein
MKDKFRIAIQHFVNGKPVGFRNVMVHNSKSLGIGDVQEKVFLLFEDDNEAAEQISDYERKISLIDFRPYNRFQTLSIQDLISMNKPLSSENLKNFCKLDKNQIDEFYENNKSVINKFGVFV